MIGRRLRRSRRRLAPLDPDRAESLAFVFEGRPMEARAGQTIAGALLAGGIDVFTRSFKLHRPRGYTCGFGACPNCPVTVDGLPGVDACTTVVRGGEMVHRERGWPSAGFDLLRTLDVARRWIPAGFQFRRFASNRGLARAFEHAAARIAGAGRLPTGRAAAARRARTITAADPDVLVVGGGRAGCIAALAAADAGASVTLVHRDLLGGRSKVRTSAVELPDGRTLPADRAAAALAEKVSAHGDIEILHGTAIGWFEDGVIPIVHGGGLAELRPDAIIVASGSYETSPLFPGNDLPGVMLSEAALRLISRERLRPGNRAIVLTDSQQGYATARRLAAVGVEVVAVVDLRAIVPGADRDTVGDGVRVVEQGQIVRVLGWTRVFAAVIVGRGKRRTVRCDLLCVALGRRPADELALQLRSSRRADLAGEVVAQDGPLRLTERAWVVGAAAGEHRASSDLAASAGRLAAIRSRT